MRSNVTGLRWAADGARQMTGAEFSAKYKLLRKVTTEGVNSYHAQHANTGQAAMVHIHSDVTVDELRARLEKLDRNDRDRILEIVEVDGSPVVVTQFIQGFRSFEEWSAEKLRPRAATQTHAPPPAAATKDAPGEFTQMFQAASGSAAPASPQPSPPAASPPAPSPQRPVAPPPQRTAEPAASGSGGESFTQLFGGGSHPAAPQSPPQAPPKMHQPPSPPVPASQPPPVPQYAAPLNPPPRPGPPPVAPPPIRQASPPPSQSAEPGSFTQMFLQPGAGSAAPPPAYSPPAYPPQAPPQNRSPFGNEGSSDSPWAEGGLPAALQPAKNSPLPTPLATPGVGGAGGRGSFTEILNSVSPAAASPPAAPPPMPPPMPRAATGPSAAQPSDFTRIVGATPSSSRAVDAPGAAPAAPRAPVPAPAAASPAAKAGDDKKMKSFVMMMALANVLFTLVVALVLFLVLR